MYLPTEADEARIRAILAQAETAVIVEAKDDPTGYEILSIANFPATCREYYIGRLVLAAFRNEFDLEGRLALARAKGART